MTRPRYWRTPLDIDRWPIARGDVSVIAERCKGCGWCVAFCPQSVLALSADFNARGYHYPVIAPGKHGACVNCGYCQAVCPDFAIYVRLAQEV